MGLNIPSFHHIAFLCPCWLPKDVQVAHAFTHARCTHMHPALSRTQSRSPIPTPPHLLHDAAQPLLQGRQPALLRLDGVEASEQGATAPERGRERGSDRRWKGDEMQEGWDGRGTEPALPSLNTHALAC